MGKSTKSERQRLGDFEILRELGRGGMGIVYEARQLSLNRNVALKVLAGSLGITPTAVMRFRREAEAAAKLHHTNIVPVYGIGEEDGTHFYAMELVDGPSLNHVITHMRQTPSDDFPLTAGKSNGEAASAVEIPPWVGETLTHIAAHPAAAAERAAAMGAKGAMQRR